MYTSNKHDDEQTLRRIVRSHSRAVRSLAGRCERDSMAVEEICADVFHLAYQRLNDLGELSEGQVRSWLLRTTRFLAANGTRRAMTRRRLFERLTREPLALVATPDDVFASEADDLAAVQRSEQIAAVPLGGLPQEQREILVLDALGEKGPALALALGISAAAARKRLMRARQAFRVSHLNEQSTKDSPREGSAHE